MSDLFGNTDNIKRKITQKAFAELIEVKPSYVCQTLVKDGVIKLDKDGLIDADEALYAYFKFRGIPRSEKLKKAAEKARAAAGKKTPDTEGDENLFGDKAAADAKAAYFKAETAELEHKKAKDLVIDIEIVRTQAFEAARKTRDKLQEIPRRIRGPVMAEIMRLSAARDIEACPHCGAVLNEDAAEPDAHAIEQMMMKEIGLALAELSDSLYKSYGVNIDADGTATA